METGFEQIRADQVRADDWVVIPPGGSSRAFYRPDAPPLDAAAAPRLVAKVDAPASFVLEDGHVCTYFRSTPVFRVR